LQIENLKQVLLLGLENDNAVAGQDQASHNQTLDVDPEHLTAGPGVGQVVDVRGDNRDEHEGHLEQSVPVHTLEVLVANSHPASVLWQSKEAAVGQPEKLER